MELIEEEVDEDMKGKAVIIGIKEVIKSLTSKLNSFYFFLFF